MSFGDKALNYIERKKAGMIALMQNLAGHAEGHMKEHASWADRTGNARSGLHAGVEVGRNRYTLFLAHGVDYGVFLELGTPPHLIKPKNKKALFWEGAAHPVKQVIHPGSKSYAIIGPTAEIYKDKVRDTVLDWWRET